MDKFEMPETDLYKELQTDEQRKDYRDTFLKALSCFAYLEEYGDLDFSELNTLEDVKSLDVSPMSKAFFSLIYLKSKIERDKTATKGTKNGYQEVLNNHEDTINIMRNILLYQDNENKSVNFFQ